MTVTISTAGETITLPSPVRPSYGPVSVTDWTDSRLTCPTDANYVRWSWPRTLGQDRHLEDVFASLGANDILVLPEDEKPWWVKVDQGFMANNALQSNGTPYARNSRVFLAMGKTQRGILGLGPGTVIGQGPRGGFTEAAQPRPKVITVDGASWTFPSSVYKILECRTDRAYFGNFTVTGQDLGGVAYSFLAIKRPGFVVERITARGAHRGFANFPNGEAAAFALDNSGTVRKVEVDCRDPGTGLPVGASPIMWNDAGTSLMEDVYLHHSVAGMPTYWRCFGTHTIRRMRSEFNGTGGGALSGSCLNVEATRAEGMTLTVEDSSLICNWRTNTDMSVYFTGTGNAGLHVSGGSATGSAKVILRRTTVDRGPANFSPAVQMIGYTPQLQRAADFTAEDSSGNSIPVRVY